MQNLQDFTSNKSCPELSQQDSDSIYGSLITTQSQNTSCDLLQHAISFPLLSTLVSGTSCSSYPSSSSSSSSTSSSSSSLLEGGRCDSGNDPDLRSSGAVNDFETDLDLGPDFRRRDLDPDSSDRDRDLDVDPDSRRRRDLDLRLDLDPDRSDLDPGGGSGSGGVGGGDSGAPTMTTTVEEETIEILSSCHVESSKSTPTPKMKARSAPVSVKLIARLEDHDPTQVNRKRVVRAVGVVTFLLLLFSVVLIGISLNMSKSIDDMVRASRYPVKTYIPRKTNRTLFEDS